MNEQNYASLEVCRRLVDTGIMLETEAWWNLHSDGWKLQLWKWSDGSVPAPSMAEVWEELPEGATLYKESPDAEYGYTSVAHLGRGSSPMFDSNPTDALCELLLWLKGERNETTMDD